MSKPSEKAAGNVKRLVGQILGDGKLVAEGERQKSEGNTEETDLSGGAKSDRRSHT